MCPVQKFHPPHCVLNPITETASRSRKCGLSWTTRNKEGKSQNPKERSVPIKVKGVKTLPWEVQGKGEAPGKM